MIDVAARTVGVPVSWWIRRALTAAAAEVKSSTKARKG
jgi:hypothetical protein